MEDASQQGKAVDTYTASQAAKVLGVSVRRVQQLAEAGEIEGVQTDSGRWRLYQHSVHARLEGRPHPTRGRSEARERRSARAAQSPESATELLERLLEAERRAARAEGRLELTERAESTLREALERERERVEQVEAERAEARREIEALRSDLEYARRPWWRRIFGS